MIIGQKNQVISCQSPNVNMFDRSKVQEGKVINVRKKTKDRFCSKGLNCSSRRKMMVKKVKQPYIIFLSILSVLINTSSYPNELFYMLRVC